jgi:glycosyltransferase involved in cell wall biosynthesis
MPPLVSVLMPVRNGERFLGRVLTALSAQRTTFPWEFIAVDSGSTDRTLALFAEFGERFPVPLRVHGIHSSEFNHGDTRNLLAALSTGEVLVFITDDAIPAGDHWLESIVANFRIPDVMVSFARNLVREDADPLTRALAATDPAYSDKRREKRVAGYDDLMNLAPSGQRDICYFSNTAAAVRRKAWLLHPFPHCEFGEDLLLGRAVIESGGAIVFDADSPVWHSHDLDDERAFLRGRVDATLSAERFGYLQLREEAEVAYQVETQLARDRAMLVASDCIGADLEREMVRARSLRTALFRGVLTGGASRRRFRPSACNATPFPSVLYCADHGHEVDRAVDCLRARGWGCAPLQPSAMPPRDGTAVVLADARMCTVASLAPLVAREVPLVALAPPRWTEGHGFARPVVAAHELGDPTIVSRCPWPQLLGEHSTNVPLELLTWPNQADIDRLRGDRPSVVDATQENVLQLEARLRSVANRARRAYPEIVSDRRASSAVAVHGSVATVDDGVLQIDPGGRVDFELDYTARGDHVLLLWVENRAGENGWSFGGSIAIDGEPVADLGQFRPWSDETRCYRVGIALAEGPHRLQVRATYLNGDPGLLRLRRLVLARPELAGDHSSRWLWTHDLRGRDGAATGAAEPQDCDSVLLGPGQNRLDFALRDLRPGAYELVVEAFSYRERAVMHTGWVLVDGTLVAVIGAWIGADEATAHTATVRVHLGAEARISLMAAEGYRLRVSRMLLRPTSPPAAVTMPLRDDRRPLDVLFDGRRLRFPLSGLERVQRNLVRELAEHPEVRRLRVLVEPNTQLPRPWPSRAEVVEAASHQAILAVLTCEPRQERPDVLHVSWFPNHHPHDLLLVPAANACVVEAHDAILNRHPEYHRDVPSWRWYDRFVRALLASCDQILVHSESARGEIERDLGADPALALVAPLAVDPAMLRPMAMPEMVDRRERLSIRGDYLLAVGKDFPHKGMTTLLRALARVPRPMRLVCAGEQVWSDGRDSAALTSQLGIADRVRWLPHLSDDDLIAVLRGAHALVYPSLEEGFGLPPLEAMALGVPVVAARAMSIPEVCGDGALYFEPGNVDDLARVLELLPAAGAEREALIARGRRRAAGFSWRQTADITIACYRHAIQRGSLRRTAQRAAGIDEPLAVIASAPYDDTRELASWKLRCLARERELDALRLFRPREVVRAAKRWLAKFKAKRSRRTGG